MAFEGRLHIDIGPLEPVLRDEHVMEVMINRYDCIFVERRGRLEEAGVRFDSEEHLMRIIQNIAEATGRVVNESNPLCDIRLPDGTRINIVLPPVAAEGAAVTMRKLVTHHWNVDDLIGFGSLTAEMAAFLRACVLGQLNIVISGGTGSGKTTVQNILIDYIPDDERLISVEHSLELQIEHKNVVRLEARPANVEGKGEISVQQLVINALKMRPDRILTSEVRGGEALHLIQAMNTGYDGCMLNLHANSPRDALARLEVMASMANVELPLLTIREQIASAVDVMIQQQRLPDGKRRILSITEVTGMQGSAIQTQDIWVFVQTGYEDDKIKGVFTPTGYVPTFMDLLKYKGLTFAEDFFTPKIDIVRALPPHPPTPPVPPTPISRMG